jgi:hypothetical protein
VWYRRWPPRSRPGAGPSRAREPDAALTDNDRIAVVGSMRAARNDAERGQHRDAPQHETHHARRRRAERHAEADLRSTTVHGVRRHAVDADPCEQQREHPEEPRQHRHEALLREGGIHLVAHRPDRE